MIQIDRISRLRSCGIFRNFTWPSDLPWIRTVQRNLRLEWDGQDDTEPAVSRP